MKKYEGRKKEENLELKKRKKIFIYSVISIVLVVIVYIITTYILTCASVINEGYFRINDFVITSKVNVEEITDNKKADENLGGNVENIPESENNINVEDEDKIESDIQNEIKLSFNVSQENIISILIPKSESAEISKVYLSNVKIKNTDRNISIINKQGLDSVLNNSKGNIDIGYELLDNQYLIEFSILNKDIIKEGKVPENVNSIVYDGTILKTLGYDINNLKYTFEAKLNIEATNGKVSVCNISLKLPCSGLGDSGIVIMRENIEKYNLKLKSKILEIFG